MKKNLMTVLILALLIVNIALTGVMLVSIVGTNKKTAQLVDNITTAVEVLSVDAVSVLASVLLSVTWLSEATVLSAEVAAPFPSLPQAAKDNTITVVKSAQINLFFIIKLLS